MSKSAKAKVDELSATKSPQLREQTIYKIRAAMEAAAYGAEKVSPAKRRQLQVRLNRAWEAATTWTDFDRQQAIEQLEREIHQVSPAKASFSIDDSNVMSDNYCRKLGLGQPVPEPNSPKNLP